MNNNTTIAATLPIEILGDIFLLLCESYISLESLDSPWDCFPYVVERVCKHWREVFISSPALWGRFSLSQINYDMMFDSAQLERRATVFLDRSRGTSLTIRIYIRTQDWPGLMSLWKILLSRSHQWKVVDLELESPSLIDDLLEYKGRMQVLESLRVYINQNTQNAGDVFGALPCLRRVYLNRWNGIFNRNFPWARLTKLKLSYDTYQSRKMTRDERLLNVMRVLGELREIEEIQFHLSIDSEDDTPLHPPIRLNRLRVLETQSSAIFSLIEGPLLEHLRVVYLFDGRRRQAYCERLSSMIRRSSCKIRKLTYICCSEIKTAESLLTILSNLEELCIEGYDAQKLANHILADPISGHLLLRVIDIKCTGDGSDLVDLVWTVSHMLKTRTADSNSKNGKVLPLERVTILFGRDRHPTPLPAHLPETALEIVQSWPSFAHLEIATWAFWDDSWCDFLSNS